MSDLVCYSGPHDMVCLWLSAPSEGRHCWHPVPNYTRRLAEYADTVQEAGDLKRPPFDTGFRALSPWGRLKQYAVNRTVKQRC